jgi:hypothetical protein
MSTSQSYLEKLRASAIKTLEEKPKYSSDIEWSPTETPTKVRFLPLPEVEGKLNFPYVTHTYHYLQGANDNGKDLKLFVPKKVLKDGREIEDPIDAFVRKLYDTKIESEKKIASSLKRKRAFYFNALVYEDGVTPSLKVIVDTSGEGKLARRICSVMGIPFCKDIDDKWFPDKDFQYDPDKPYFDLISTSEGFDFKIKKSITGKDPWNFDYNESFPITNKGFRALNDVELSLANKAENLHEYVKYVSDYYEVENYLNRAIANLGGQPVEIAKETKVASPRVASPKVSSPVIEEELDEDDLRAQLLD